MPYRLMSVIAVSVRLLILFSCTPCRGRRM